MSQPVVIFCENCGKGINLITGETVYQCKSCKKRICSSCFYDDGNCKQCQYQIKKKKEQIEFPKKICLNCVKTGVNKHGRAIMEDNLKPITDSYCNRCKKPLYQINSKKDFYSLRCKNCGNLIEIWPIDKDEKWVCTSCGKKNDFEDWENDIRIRFNVVDWKDVIRSKLNF